MCARYLVVILAVLAVTAGAAAQVERPGEPSKAEIGGRVVVTGSLFPGRQGDTARII